LCHRYQYIFSSRGIYEILAIDINKFLTKEVFNKLWAISHNLNKLSAIDINKCLTTDINIFLAIDTDKLPCINCQPLMLINH
jgi:hypothetical protein